VFEAYLREYPNGRYLAQARVRLAELKDATKPSSAAEPPKPAVPPAPTFAVPARSDDPETDFWSEVKASGTREYLDAYLRQYPKGKYVALAKVELKKLDDKERAERAKLEAERKAALAREEAERKATAAREQQEARQAEQAAWERAKTSNTAAAYADYLGSHPRGRYAALAQASQQKAQRDEAEQAKREAAQREREADERARQEAARLAKEAAEMRPGKVLKDCADCPEMVVIPAGSFEMGSNDYDSEKPTHRVTLKGFALGRTEVTQGQWKSVMGSNPSQFSSCGDDCPVETFSWDDAKEYIRKLNAKTGKSYRLPSEAEWEYAARAETTTRYPWGNEASHEYANYGKDQCCEGYASGRDRWVNTAPVGEFSANAFGLYDMHGNVWEWIEDCWNSNYNGAPFDGSVWISGNCSERVLRGGSWTNNSRDLRSASRYGRTPGYRYGNLGFRLARTLF
jgi:formylglycine-generating enzyme required for sulfatase activity